MSYIYKVFNPETSRTAREIMNSSDYDLIKKYIKKKSATSKKLIDTMKDEVNKIDDEEYLINPYLYLMEGPNLNNIAGQLQLIASQLKVAGYELRLDNVMSDFNKMFSEHHNIIRSMTKTSPIHPLTKDVIYFFFMETINNRVIKALEASNNANFEQ